MLVQWFGRFDGTQEDWKEGRECQSCATRGQSSHSPNSAEVHVNHQTWGTLCHLQPQLDPYGTMDTTTALRQTHLQLGKYLVLLKVMVYFAYVSINHGSNHGKSMYIPFRWGTLFPRFPCPPVHFRLRRFYVRALVLCKQLEVLIGCYCSFGFPCTCLRATERESAWIVSSKWSRSACRLQGCPNTMFRPQEPAGASPMLKAHVPMQIHAVHVLDSAVFHRFSPLKLSDSFSPPRAWTA